MDIFTGNALTSLNRRKSNQQQQSEPKQYQNYKQGISRPKTMIKDDKYAFLQLACNFDNHLEFFLDKDNDPLRELPRLLNKFFSSHSICKLVRSAA
ncbi:hypothetical protein FBU30_010650 [Linnemannia zychae]|nr:hypothetical protein FBU30_010650 [Linnemannia zychae]